MKIPGKSQRLHHEVQDPRDQQVKRKKRNIEVTEAIIMKVK